MEYKLEAAMRIMEECKAVDAVRWTKAEQHAYKEEQIAMKGDMVVEYAINRRSESCVLTFSDSGSDSDSDSDDLDSIEEVDFDSGDDDDNGDVDSDDDEE